MSPRVATPEKLKRETMYESAYRCAVCQKPGSHIHHIDKDSSNNNKDNLILVCVAHHDEAHTKKENSLNLTTARLKDARKRWTQTVLERRGDLATLQGQLAQAENGFLRVGVTWGYINHRRVSQLLHADILGEITPAIRSRLMASGVIDENGILIRPDEYALGHSHFQNTIYDWYNYADSHALHRFYAEAVDAISRRSSLVFLDRNSWTKGFFKQFLKPGALVFYEKAHHFKEVYCDQENAHIEVRTFKRNVEIQFGLDTRDMFGTTSISTSFKGHSVCSALLVVKSLAENADRKLVVSASPIALGVGFDTRVTDQTVHT